MKADSHDNSLQSSAEDRALERFADLMIDKISSLQGDWRQPWFTEGALSWPKNLSGRRYNGMNAVMLMMHCEKEGYRLPVFCTFERVISLNYKDREGARVRLTGPGGEELPMVSVNRGARSFPVFLTTFTVVDRETREKIRYDDYRQLSAEEQQRYEVYPKMSVYNVFNVDQTNMKEARPDMYRKLEEQNIQVRPQVSGGEDLSFPAVDDMIAGNGWICPIRPVYGNDAYYSISRDEIVVPEKRQFIDGESFYSNLLHEMSHSTGSESRLNRLKPGQSFGSAEYAREELVAELTAALVSSQYGMTKHVKSDSAAYLKGWLERLKKEPSFIKTVLTDVKRASQMIIQGIEAVRLQLENGAREGRDNAVALQAGGTTGHGGAVQDAGFVEKDSAAVVLSPMMKQFLDLKSKHPDALLLFRCGDFYETYQQDARKASQILGITLTKSSKTKGPDGNPVEMAGFPYHALDAYLPKLIRAGQRVAICDQLEAPRQTARRGVSETVSPGANAVKEQQAKSRGMKL